MVENETRLNCVQKYINGAYGFVLASCLSSFCVCPCIGVRACVNLLISWTCLWELWKGIECVFVTLHASKLDSEGSFCFAGLYRFGRMAELIPWNWLAFAVLLFLFIESLFQNDWCMIENEIGFECV